MLSITLLTLASFQSSVPEDSLRFIDPMELIVCGPDAVQVERPASIDSVSRSGAPAGLRFVENRGQWPEGARFAVDAGNVRGWVEDDGIALDLAAGVNAGRTRGTVVRLAFEGAEEVVPQGEERLGARYEYRIGNDPERWGRAARSFERVVWSGLYPSIDLVLREGASGLEYDLLVGASADVASLVIRSEGADGLSLDESGSLVIETAHGPLRQPAPTTWAVLADGTILPLDCRFRILDDTRYGFEIPQRPEAASLVIDPGLHWSTFLGGNAFDGTASDMARDDAGRIYVGGLSSSPNFPTTVGAYDRTNAGNGDAWVACLSADGTTLIWSTFLGGAAGVDRVRDLSIDAAGNVIVGGETGSMNLPVTAGAIQPSFGGGASDGFVAVFDSTGSQLKACTYLGGFGTDFQEAEYVIGLEVDAAGTITVSGNTNSSNFPTTAGAFDTTHNPGDAGVGAYDAFIARLNSDCTTLLYSTFVGGSGVEYGYDLALLDDTRVVLAAATSSFDAPITPGCFDTTYAGAGQDTLVVILNLVSSGAADLEYGTYWGGSVNDFPFCVAVGPTGEPTVAGITWSEDCDTTAGAFREVSEADTAQYVFRISPLGQGAADLAYSTYFGGPQPIGSYVMGFAVDVEVDDQDRVTLTGDTSSPAFHVTGGALQSTWGGSNDSFQWGDVYLVRLRFTGLGNADLLYGTYLGGLQQNRGFGLSIGSGDDVTLVGYTLNGDFPSTAGAYDPTYNGGEADVFLLEAELIEGSSGQAFCFGDGTGTVCPCGVVGAVGQGCPNTNPNGNGAKLVAMGEAFFANDTLGFAISDGAATKPGILIQGGAALGYPNGNPNVPNASGIFCVSPSLRGNVFFTDGSGAASVSDFQGQPFGASAGAAGTTTYYQYWFRDPGNACQNAPGTAAAFNFSNAWEVIWL